MTDSEGPLKRFMRSDLLADMAEGDSPVLGE